MRQLFFIYLLSALLCACGTHMRVAKIDEKTGLLKSEMGEVDKATIVTAKKIPLATYKSMVFVSNGGDYGINQTKEIKYFDQVLNYDDLQKLVIANNLQDKVPSLNEKIGINKLYHAYKPFLWINFKNVQRENKTFIQLVVTNPENLEDVFVSEIFPGYGWGGVNDQSFRYPLFNALIAWINENR